MMIMGHTLTSKFVIDLNTDVVFCLGENTKHSRVAVQNVGTLLETIEATNRDIAVDKDSHSQKL
jgi:hypothetical protein